VRNYVNKINELLAKMAEVYLEYKPKKKDEAVLKAKDVENMMIKQSIIINNDIFERNQDLDKSFE
jgi:hypothetical protein